MKKLLMITAAAVMGIALVGCGKPKIPANAVAAAYVDLDKLFNNAQDVAETVIDELGDHKEIQSDLQKQYDELLANYKKIVKPGNLEWALLFTLKVQDEFVPGFVVRCDYNAKIDGGEVKSFREAIELLKIGDRYQIDKCDAMTMRIPDYGYFSLAFVNDTYIVGSTDKDALMDLVHFYADGKGDVSEGFDSLFDLDDDTVARFQSANAETLIDLFGARDQLKDFGEKSGDKDLADMVADIGNISLDINFSEDNLGCRLTVDAGCRELAKLVEGIWNVYVFGTRIVADAIQYSVNSQFAEYAKGYIGNVTDDTRESAEALADLIRDGVESDRSGSVTTLTVEFDTEDLVELIVDAVPAK